MASRLRRRLITTIVVLLAAGLLVLGYRPAPVLVDMDTVSRGHLAITVEDEGRTRVMDRYTVSAPLASHARRITLEAGDEVTAGQVLATLDALAAPPLDVRSIQESRARVAAAESGLETAREELSAAEARARFARDELARLKGLEAREMISPSDVERAAAEARQSEALARSAGFRMETARAQLEATRSALGVEEQRVWVIADITSEPPLWQREGDRVVVHPDREISEGVRLRVRGE